MKLIELTSDGQNTAEVDLDTAVVTFVTRYNYSAECWVLDLYDSEGSAILLGLMLVPGIDLLIPYQHQKQLYGGLVLVEKEVGDYMDPAGLGTSTKLLWYPPGEEVVIPT